MEWLEVRYIARSYCYRRLLPHADVEYWIYGADAPLMIFLTEFFLDI